MDIAGSPDPAVAGRASATRLVLVTCIALLVITGIVIVTLSGAPTGPSSFDEDTPAGAIQSYLRAYVEGDADIAYAAFSSRVQARLRRDDFESVADGWGREQLRRQRIVLDRVDTDAESATVHLTVSTSDGDPRLDLGPHGWQTSVRLVRERGRWLIDEPLAGIDSYWVG